MKTVDAIPYGRIDEFERDKGFQKVTGDALEKIKQRFGNPDFWDYKVCFIKGNDVYCQEKGTVYRIMEREHLKNKVWRGVPQEEDALYFDLDDQNGEIVLYARDKTGKRLTGGGICSITRDGKLRKWGAIPPSLGLSTANKYWVIDETE